MERGRELPRPKADDRDERNRGAFGEASSVHVGFREHAPGWGEGSTAESARYPMTDEPLNQVGVRCGPMCRRGTHIGPARTRSSRCLRTRPPELVDDRVQERSTGGSGWHRRLS
jgi:hypothetical protein